MTPLLETPYSEAMYVPAKFREPDETQLLQLIRDYPLATVWTHADGPPCVNHLPVLAERRGEELVLFGHLARANPQWRHFAAGAEALVIFHGPHAYITPQWYPDPLNVPTWNYAVVHATGRATAIEDGAAIEEILKKSVAEFERHEAKPWRYELPEDFRADLIRAVVGFELRAVKLEGKFKLSQNREPADRAGVLAGLATRGDEMSARTRNLMINI